MSSAERDVYFQKVAAGSDRLTLSGLTVSGAFFAAILGAMPTTTDNLSGSPRPVIAADAFFDETVFTDFVDAQHVTFRKACSMTKAVFEKGCIFNGSNFGSLVDLRKTRILGTTSADFSNVIFRGKVWCAGLESSRMLNFVRAQMESLDLRWCQVNGIWLSYAHIRRTLLGTDASFASRFEGSADVTDILARLDGLTVEGAVDFSNATFPYETTVGGYADMPPARLESTISFRGCTFGSPDTGGRYLLQHLNLIQQADFSGCTFFGRVSFRASTFSQRLLLRDLAVSECGSAKDENDRFFPATTLDLTEISIPAGTVIENVTVTGSVAIECTSPTGDIDIKALSATRTVDLTHIHTGYFPAEIIASERLSFTRCQFTNGGIVTCQTPNLSFIECDARKPLTVASATKDDPARLVSFRGTNLEYFVLSGIDMTATIFTGAIGIDALSIQGAPRFLRSPVLLGATRRVVQDEVVLRSSQKRWRRRVYEASPAQSALDSHIVAAVYRSLRKSLEDSKDEPGAADFYYGEMEMRRIGAPLISTERWLLTLYWFFSGYALRAWRALATLAVVISVGALLLRYTGYQHRIHPAFGTEIVQLIQISIGLSRPPADLSISGSITVIAVRVLLPILVALALFALRGRVRR